MVTSSNDGGGGGGVEMVRDTSREDELKRMTQAWETEQPGRLQKVRSPSSIYLLLNCKLCPCSRVELNRLSTFYCGFVQGPFEIMLGAWQWVWPRMRLTVE